MNDRRQKQLLLLFATMLFCTISFFLFDQSLTLFFRQFNTGLWRDIWKAITKAGQSEWYLVGGLLLFAGFRKRNRRLSAGGLLLFSAVAASGLTADILKFILGRARPKLLLQQGIYGFDLFGWHLEHAWQSFPSGHAATALSAALSLSLLFPRFRPAFLAGAMLIAASRVVLCQHYLSDIVAGSALGAATVALLYQRYFRNAFDETATI
ncbi:phosphatase PAP2 family protein [Chlorobaculum limnaeum]|uniref:Phosphatase PAP2 family protein n=1 Tax=Chlorobaculum limnaeum TaxID=274537 RepID=A0A1D8D1D6_CHLLM|nr:phosphatase PAP2 family protein [Chlorobaculum limnaeum]AOS84960.1 phosphatase PAP2 family protein [Chlorobaculum limnaeum]